MIIARFELRQGRLTLALWTAAIGLLLIFCLLMFPEIRGAVDGVFASMGSFTAAFGMDRLKLGTLSGFYAVECGSILGLGGAFYACLLGISALAREERDRTAAFLLTHPLSRARVVTEKLAAVLTQLLVMDAAVFAAALLTVRLIGEPIPWREMSLLHLACFLLQGEMACVCLGISAFLRRSGAGLAMGLAATMYFLELIANMAERARFLKYITPFGYCEGADIIAAGGLDGKKLAIGALLACLGLAAAYGRYGTKDIRST